ncbi:MAG: segregation/condensation protein A [Candidatus Nanoarchaeia archaeon]
MQDRLFEMLVQQDEITWQTIIYDLIRTEQMDPWDIDVSLLAQKYIETVNKLQEMNFFISGKVLLASALLLKIKSHKLMEEDIAGFDSYLFNTGEEELSLGDLDEIQRLSRDQLPKLTIKTPQARKRKVNLQDLMNALQKALEVNQRRVIRRIREEKLFNPPQIPERKIEISKLIKDLYEKIMSFFHKQETVTFTKLVPSERKEDKIMTLIPLLHLDTQGRINMVQNEPFGEIEIRNIQI